MSEKNVKKFIPLFEKSVPFLVSNCEVIFLEKNYIKIALPYVELCKIKNEAAKIVMAKEFVIEDVIFASTNTIVYDASGHVLNAQPQPNAQYFASVQLTFRWLIKSAEGFRVKPHVEFIQLQCGEQSPAPKKLRFTVDSLIDESS